jgi:hypothetical protein
MNYWAGYLIVPPVDAGRLFHGTISISLETVWRNCMGEFRNAANLSTQKSFAIKKSITAGSLALNREENDQYISRHYSKTTYVRSES